MTAMARVSLLVVGLLLSSCSPIDEVSMAAARRKDMRWFLDSVRLRSKILRTDDHKFPLILDVPSQLDIMPTDGLNDKDSYPVTIATKKGIIGKLQVCTVDCPEGYKRDAYCLRIEFVGAPRTRLAGSWILDEFGRLHDPNGRIWH